MQHNRFALLEAKQVGTRGAQTLYAHSEPQAGTASTNGALAALLGAAGATKVDVKQSTSAWGLPPSSTMSFLLRGGLAIPHVVLTDHNAAYTCVAYLFAHSLALFAHGSLAQQPLLSLGV